MREITGAAFTYTCFSPRHPVPILVRCRRAVALAMFVLALTPPPVSLGGAADSAAQAAAKSFQAKVQTLGNDAPQKSYSAVVITAYETNAYLNLHSKEFLPAGVASPSVNIQPEHATAAGDVNFDELSRANPNEMGPKVLAAMFHGTQHVTVAVQIRSESAGVRMQIESLVVGSMTVPHWLVDLMIQNFIQPRYHVDLSKPLPYPDHVTRVVLGSGQVTFLQGPKPHP